MLHTQFVLSHHPGSNLSYLLIEKYGLQLQGKLHNDFSKTSKNNGIICYLGALPIAIIDAGIETIKTPLLAIECLARAFTHLVACPFSKKYKIKNAILFTENSLLFAVTTPVRLLLAPIKIIFQTYRIMSIKISTRYEANVNNFTSDQVVHTARFYRDETYNGYLEISRGSELVKYTFALPVATADIAIDLLKQPFVAIEKIANAISNLQFVTSYEYSLKGVVFGLESAAVQTLMIPVKIVLAPIKIIYQTVNILQLNYPSKF